MRNIIVPLLLISVLVTCGSVAGQEPEAKSKIVSVGIFKNGLAVVKREVQVPAAGSYRFDTVPEPLHGSFWIASNCRVETALKMREVDVPLFSGTMGGLQEELAGKEVVIHLKDGKPASAGTVQRIEIARTAEEERTPRAAPAFLIVKTASGYSYVNPAEIAHIEVKHKEQTVKRQRPVLILSVDKADQKPVVFVSYLTRSLGWAPSYLVDITDAKSLSIEMAAVIRNELADLKDTEVKLHFGYPGVQFAQVPSPLSPRVSWDKFVAALANEAGEGRIGRGMGLPPLPGTASAVAGGESADTHIETLGKRDLKQGEALSLTLAKSKAAYERVVDWTVSGNDSGTIAEELWDVYHFKNPFAVPMATGPALLMDKDQFSGQRAAMPAKVGEEASLRIRRSAAVRTRGQETEIPLQKDAKPEVIRIGLYDYRRATVDGEMTVTNNRKEAIKMIVRRALLAKVLSTQGDPKIHPRDEGVRTVNPSHEIVWTLNLAPGEEKTLRYRYSAFLLDQKVPLSYGW